MVFWKAFPCLGDGLAELGLDLVSIRFSLESGLFIGGGLVLAASANVALGLLSRFNSRTAQVREFDRNWEPLGVGLPCLGLPTMVSFLCGTGSRRALSALWYAAVIGFQ
jgi:hypothetical protein